MQEYTHLLSNNYFAEKLYPGIEKILLFLVPSCGAHLHIQDED
jgi:hypothetical protein